MAGINTVRQGIGWVSLAICAAGVIAPRPLARLMGDDASLARPLALRDGAIGLAVLQSRGPLPLLLRTAADLIDAHRLRRRSPLAAAGALSFGLLALATAVAPALRQRQAP